MKVRFFALLGLAVLGMALLPGCSTDTSLTKEEKAQIKGGGPMPPEAIQDIAKRQALAQQAMQRSAAQQGGALPPASAAGAGK